MSARVSALDGRAALSSAGSAALDARDLAMRVADGLTADGARVFANRHACVSSLRIAADILAEVATLLYQESQQDATWGAS